MSTKIEYNGSIVVEIPNGSTATLPIKDKKMATDILVTVPEAEVIPDYTETDFALHYSSEDRAINVVYSSTERASFEAAPEGAVIDSFGDGNFTASNIKSGVSIFGIEGTYAGEELTLEEITITEDGEYTPSGDGYSKVTVNVSKEKYDGSVVISAPSLSGTWLIDSDKLYNLLLETRDNIAQSLNFSAGVKGSDAGVIYYTSMTFDFGTKALQYSGDDGTNSFSNYNYSAYGDGWKEYPDTSNGATVNIDEEQAVSANFYLLFTSIATKEV